MNRRLVATALALPDERRVNLAVRPMTRARRERARLGRASGMRGLTFPGAFRPRSDTWLLAATARRAAVPAGGRILELCAGPGFAGLSAALASRASLTTVDVSRRAVWNARLNARLNRVPVRALRGDLFAAVPGETFDLILANPPYVPGPAPPGRGQARAWDAGGDGRAILDRICADAPAHLRPGGTLLVVHSEVCGEQRTLDAFAAGGLEADIANRECGPLGPLLRGRRDELEARGLLAPGQEEEAVLVLRGRLVGRTSARCPIPTP
jgi:release factor glutamine methyltransferase